MNPRWLAFGALCAVSVCGATLADEPAASLHYRDLLGIQDRFADLQDLKRLKIDLRVRSTRNDVAPGDIKLVIHRASGELISIPIDKAGHISLPVSDELKAENPPITSNQPNHTLTASIDVRIQPLTRTQVDYVFLMSAMQQFNEAIDRQGIVVTSFTHKADAMILLYTRGEHSLTLHGKGGDRILKGEALKKDDPRLPHVSIDDPSGTARIIYIPLDPKLLAENPDATLDALPDDIFPAI
jgi:hypothetical protein